jgi:hypothetical protein
MVPVISEVSGVTFLCVPGVYDAYLVGWLCYGESPTSCGQFLWLGILPIQFQGQFYVQKHI